MSVKQKKHAKDVSPTDSYNWSPQSLKKCMSAISDSSCWESQFKFQRSVVQNASQRMNKRLIGWLAHNKMFTDDQCDEQQVRRAWLAFEKKHLHAYKQWKKRTGAKGGFDERVKKKDVLNVHERLCKLFLYYLVEGEIHDFRGQKNVFHIFYHVALDKYKNGDESIAEWIRDQGHKLYRIFSLVYSKDEMNHECFHHDDLDDVCNNSSFVRKFLETRDWLIAFGLDLAEGKKRSFPHLSKLLAIETPKFIKFWVKGAQASLNDKEREERDSWISNNISYDDDTKNELEEFNKKLAELQPEVNKANETRLASEQKRANCTQRDVPSEDWFDDKPDLLHNYRLAFTQLETAKELLQATEKLESEAQGLVMEAKIQHFRERKSSAVAYETAVVKFEQAENDFDEARRGFETASEVFTSLRDSRCNKLILDAIAQRDRAEWKRKSVAEQLIKIQISKRLQFSYEDCINKERKKFAKKWKSYFEKSGGALGCCGYFTLAYHFSKIVYMHILLLIPIIWFYFDYHKYIEFSDVSTLIGLVDTEDMFNPETSTLPLSAGVIVLLILAFLMFNVCIRWKLRGRNSSSRGLGTPVLINLKARLLVFLLWILILATEIILMKLLVLDPIKEATDNFIIDFDIIKSPPLLLVHWLPTIVLYVSSIQFVFTLWVGIFGFYFGWRDGVHKVRTWKHVISHFETRVSAKEGSEVVKIPILVQRFYETMMPSECKSETPTRKHIAFAQVWNSIITSFYEIHKISKEELQRYTYKIKNTDNSDFLSGTIVKEPDLLKEPNVEEVKYHLVRFINNVMMKNKPKATNVKEMQPLTIVTPVGAERILYQYEFITHIDNTQSSFLQHLIRKQYHEWQNFKKKECLSAKAKDWVERMEKDILQGVQPDLRSNKGQKKWIHDTTEGLALKVKICEWASLRFQALYRTVYGFMQVPIALQILARIQNPKMSQEDAEDLVRNKFSYIVGYQSFSGYHKIYKSTKHKARDGSDLTKSEMEAHEAVYNIKFLKRKFPELKIAYPDQTEDGKFVARLCTGVNNTYCSYTIDLFGPFGDMGLGKPAHQNFLCQFIDGSIVQTIDVNQDNVISQSFFIPNVLTEFDNDSRVKIIGCPEFVITTRWSATAWCSAFSERTFGTLVQRCYARLGLRLHYGHPDYLDGFWVMSETGLSKLPYVSEDIFTGIDTVLKGGKIIHVEYHEVGKARDVDLYTTTKFMRKISMGASQVACSRYMNQLQTSSNVSLFQALGYYYSTIGFYVNHLILYLSVWFALVSQLILILVQRVLLGDEISNFITTRIFAFQVGFALMAPGLMQLWLEKGFFAGTWAYISHFCILAVYSTFHILNISSYWQYGLTNSAFYLASGRGTGLEHYSMKEMYDSFYKTHWRAGYIIFWMGLLALILGGSVFVFLVMYMLPAGVWLWGAMFLNPGSLPSTVHEEQWKRLMNIDTEQGRELVKLHCKLNKYHPPPQGNIIKRFVIRIWRAIVTFFRAIHWSYCSLNVAIHLRMVRFFAIFTLAWKWIFAHKIPTHIFTDERRRVLRWEEEETRMKSIFYSSRLDDNSKTASARVKKLIKPPAGSITAPPPKSPAAATPAVPLETRPLPTPPPAQSGQSARKRSVRFLNIKKRDSSASSSGSNSSSNDSGSSGSGSSSNSSGSSSNSSGSSSGSSSDKSS